MPIRGTWQSRTLHSLPICSTPPTTRQMCCQKNSTIQILHNIRPPLTFLKAINPQIKPSCKSFINSNLN